MAEAQITGQLEHPNIVPVHALGVSAEGVPYFTMKLVHGVAFNKWLADPTRAPGSSERLQGGLEIFLKVCEAIAYAHDRGVIHRDLKPENIMVGSFGQVYVMDWGLARLTRSAPASGARAQMEAKGPVGTPPYMAPEQARGNPHEMDERTDVFGLGAVLYQIVSGKLPYGPMRDPKVLLERVRTGATVPLDGAIGALPIAKRIRTIVEKAIAQSPADRHQSVVELEDEVRRFLRGGLYLPSKSFSAGQLVIREGDVGDAAYMIVSGTCRAYRDVDGLRRDAGHHGPRRRVRRDGALALRAAGGERRGGGRRHPAGARQADSRGRSRHRWLDRRARAGPGASLPRPGGAGARVGAPEGCRGLSYFTTVWVSQPRVMLTFGELDCLSLSQAAPHKRMPLVPSVNCQPLAPASQGAVSSLRITCLPAPSP